MKKVTLFLVMICQIVLFMACSDEEEIKDVATTQNEETFYSKLYSYLYQKTSYVKESLLDEGYHYIYGDSDEFWYGKISENGDTNIIVGDVRNYNTVFALYYLQSVKTKETACYKFIETEKNLYQFCKAKDRDMFNAYILQQKDVVDSLYDRADYLSLMNEIKISNIDWLWSMFGVYQNNTSRVIMMDFEPSNISSLYNYHGEFSGATPKLNPAEWEGIIDYKLIVLMGDFNTLYPENKKIISNKLKHIKL